MEKLKKLENYFKIHKLTLIGKIVLVICTPFYVACQKGHIEIVKLLSSDKRVDFNKAENNGFSPFLIVCYAGKTEAVKYLLGMEEK